MAALRALLELFGSLDTAAERSDNPEVQAAIAALVPGNPDDTGWYAELDAFMFPGGDRTQPGRSSDPPRTEADFNLALQDLTDPTRTDAETPLAIPEKARLMYGIMAAAHVERVAPGTIPGFADALQGDGTLDGSPVVRAFRLAGPSEERSTTSGTPPATVDFETLLSTDTFPNALADQLTSIKVWKDVAPELAAQYGLDPLIAHNLLEGASVVSVKGVKSLVVDTQFDSDEASLEQVKAVVDPRNWHLNYPAFFCDMEGNNQRTDQWRRVLETVGAAAVPYSRRLRTNLKFFKQELNDAKVREYWAHLDYDLNDPIPDKAGDGQIDVDRGYINMKAKPQPDGTVDPTKKGVVIRTRKVAHIKGIRPETQARFCLVFGYTAGALDMLIGPATDPNRDVSKYYPWPDTPDKPREIKKPPPPSSNSVASTAFKMAVTYSEDLMVRNLDLADKWMSGGLTVKDLADFSSEFGARLASDPWKFLQAIVPPPSQGGGK